MEGSRSTGRTVPEDGAERDRWMSRHHRSDGPALSRQVNDELKAGLARASVRTESFVTIVIPETRIGPAAKEFGGGLAGRARGPWSSALACAGYGSSETPRSPAPNPRANTRTEVGGCPGLFARCSTGAGGAGSVDTPRDVRGFAVKFYTREGNWDLVGNNIPVFFIQDAIKFPDLIHAVKPEPHNEIPQAASAHDTFYDFISLSPAPFHTLM